ncbi:MULTISPECIES: molecular chaperone [unclassified Pseudomonas]|uniref:fimbrial biogenesis chaperone n=1 Tax=unclassified Pseudomonas TaxID=196821 RepID=UPI000BCC84D1|nr:MULTISPECIES: molecular chaperone [unclassified Pseudomonas]PVZ16415.1 chaperone protein EcpD [Pseudomonas sp. URIL14HWK12:I12]PVZ25729.1 chaperone protein EcpD [Pseudomonas sp. URIL14HWK12:I10]PVZ36747.1 chaperone protein EcpD [Pseudomonas sp. URIL14HWK12:I11]SNZ12694.1 chaperone protein EcpD [Pseudomonas sp. URIL14HWK12:I9]
MALTLSRRNWLAGTIACACVASTGTTQAALTLNATRLVISTDQRSSALMVRNPSKQTWAAQAWVNTEADDTTTAVPLMASPALFRLEPGQEQRVTLNRLPAELPEDRESVFYFNVQEIPQKTDSAANQLRVALRTRIKVFLRPARFTGDPAHRLAELRWSRGQAEGKHYIEVDNPLPFHYSFVTLNVKSGSQQQALTSAPMVAPFSRQRYPVNIPLAEGARLKVAAINDYGGFTAVLDVPLATAR